MKKLLIALLTCAALVFPGCVTTNEKKLVEDASICPVDNLHMIQIVLQSPDGTIEQDLEVPKEIFNPMESLYNIEVWPQGDIYEMDWFDNSGFVYSMHFTVEEDKIVSFGLFKWLFMTTIEPMTWVHTPDGKWQKVDFDTYVEVVCKYMYPNNDCDEPNSICYKEKEKEDAI